MRTVEVRGRMLDVNLFRGLSSERIDELLQFIHGVGPYNVPTYRKRILNALAEEKSPGRIRAWFAAVAASARSAWDNRSGFLSRALVVVGMALVLLWLALLVVLGALYVGSWLRSNFPPPWAVESGAPVVAEATPTQFVAFESSVLVAEASEEKVHLRVETQRLDTQYGIWRRMPDVPIYLSPYEEGDVTPNSGRDGTQRQVTEEKPTHATHGGVLVAETTFTSSPGLYWVWVDRDGLPEGCEVWLPIFGEDNLVPYKLNPWKIIFLNFNDGGNTTVVKFQIICGVERATPMSPPPGETPTSPPTSTPPPGETPTSPPPTPTPEPTETEEPVCVECETPSTPVPTPTAYPNDEPTPTSVFGD